jgi:hypothetical protein
LEAKASHCTLPSSISVQDEAQQTITIGTPPGGRILVSDIAKVHIYNLHFATIDNNDQDHSQGSRRIRVASCIDVRVF